jgi:Mrp family chromosome partitioning ATPase
LGVAQLGEAIVRIPIGGSDSVAGTFNGNAARRLARGALDVLPSGPIPPDPGEFVGTDRLTEILEHIRAHADVVLIDAPPLLHVGDGLALSAKVDAVLVVTRMEMMRRPILGELERLLETMPAHKLGFVVTGAEAEEGYGYGYGYGGYAYHRAYGPREKAASRT